VSIIPAITHPAFCDSRACTTNKLGDVDHAELGMPIRPTGSDVEITVRLVRTDEPGPCGSTGDVQVQLTIDDLGFTNTAGELIRADAWLSLADARLVGAALTVAADRGEREQRSADLARGAR
jgi:hypothetical protein